MFAHPARARQHALARHRSAYGAESLQEQADRVNAEWRAQTDKATDDKAVLEAAKWGLAGIAVVGIVVGVGVFAINPWIVKAFKPEWSYGRRLAASFGVTFVAGTLTGIARGLGGVQDTPATTAPATK